MQMPQIEVNDIVCIEFYPQTAIVHMKGGRYFNLELEDARTLQSCLNDRLLKVMAVFGDPPKPNMKGLN